MNYIKQLKEMFPEVKFETSNNEQIAKVIDECYEVLDEINKKKTNKNRSAHLLELVDVIHAAANALYKSEFNVSELNEAIDHVKVKNNKRNYYKMTDNLINKEDPK